MDAIFDAAISIFYPFWYFLVLGIVFSVCRLTALFLVGAGRLKSFHALENYWIYLLVTVFCAAIGAVVGQGQLILFCRWFLCTLLAGLAGTYFGIDKGLQVSQEELDEIEDEAKQGK